MGRLVGIEPTHAGATIQCVNRFTKAAIPNRQLPILPARLQASTFGLYVLNCCVRYGNRWNHIGIITGLLTCPRSKPERVQLIGQQVVCENVPRVKPEGHRRLADVDRRLRDFNSLKTIQKKLLWNTLDFLAKLSPRPISTALLHPSRDFHLQPIYLVFLKGSY